MTTKSSMRVKASPLARTSTRFLFFIFRTNILYIFLQIGQEPIAALPPTGRKSVFAHRKADGSAGASPYPYAW
jgi:hypothetical protein